MKRAILASSMLLMGIGLLFVFVRPAEAAIDSTPDCDTVAIVKCGVTAANVKAKAKEADVPKVYAAFGIQNSELSGFVDGVVWRDGRVTVGHDKLVATGAVTAGRWYNPTSDMTRIAGTDRAYKMSTSHFVDEGQTALIKMVDGKFQFAVIKSCGNPVKATPVAPTPKPTYACRELTKQKIDRDTFKFTASATADNGAKIAKYRFDFGDGNKETSTDKTIKHTYSKPGTYTVRVTALVNVDGKLVEATSNDCVKQVTVEKPAKPTPEYACKSMSLFVVDGDRRIVRTTTEHVATNGAKFNHYLIDFGDGTPAVRSTTGKERHTYAKEGTYTVKAQVVVTVKGTALTVTSERCARQVTFTHTAPPTITPTIPVAPTEPDEPDTVIVTASAPKALVDTGPGEIVGAVVSVVAAGSLAYRLVWLRLFI